MLVNGSGCEQTFGLPSAPDDEPWICQFDTALDRHSALSLGRAHDYRLAASSVALLEC